MSLSTRDSDKGFFAWRPGRFKSLEMTQTAQPQTPAPPAPATTGKRKFSDWEEWWSEESGDDEAVAKYVRLVDTVPKQILCTLSAECENASVVFDTRAEYRNHCRDTHCNPCTICRRILPTRKLLDLHQNEIHDPFFSARAEAGNAYECFVDGCSRMCSGPFKRKLHLMDKHNFPSSFNFHVILGKGRGKLSVNSRKPQIRLKSPSRTDGSKVVEAGVGATIHSESSDSFSTVEMDILDTATDVQSNLAADTADTTAKSLSKIESNAEKMDQDDDVVTVDKALTANTDEDPFQALVGSLKKLSLVPRTVSRPKSSTGPSPTTAKKLANPNSMATAQSKGDGPSPNTLNTPSAAPTLPKAVSPKLTTTTKQKVSFVGHLGSGAAMASIASTHHWTRDKVLAAYLSNVPSRAKEAERVWKEKRAQRKASAGVAVDGGEVEMMEAENDSS
ncbi:hypothetical protein HDU81_001718 [Chytriomyces hyalinus]|nr:hypothetical protein HDU81_001718 [Chytriomyces hyalinus]